MIAVDLFAGPGGWDVAAHWLGVDPLGIEWDAAACRVREAAGHRTLQADVAALDPHDFPCDLLIASPPCTAFSMAGKGAGRDAMDELLAGVSAMDDFGLCAHGVEDFGGETDRPPIPYLNIEDPTAPLVLEPLRWALALQPDTVCCEQVPPVLPLWEAMATVLQRRGYKTWTGIVSSERYGVPQTRKRAFLIASKHRTVREPQATHQRYVAPRNRDDAGGGLFDLPDPERLVAKGDEHLKPWVSMAEALGWGDGAAVQHRHGGDRLEEEWSADRPAATVTTRVNRWQVGFPRLADDGAATEDGYRERDFRDVEEPAPALTEKARSWELRQNARANATVRLADEPAPTITGGHDHGERQWVKNWVAVRVTIEQAARLQGFPDNYPWAAAGSRSKAFQCIGNAVPPPMTQAVLREAIGGSDHE